MTTRTDHANSGLSDTREVILDTSVEGTDLAGTQRTYAGLIDRSSSMIETVFESTERCNLYRGPNGSVASHESV